jgi:hypothetical protein
VAALRLRGVAEITSSAEVVASSLSERGFGGIRSLRAAAAGPNIPAHCH